jgi:hypothetical protein
MNILLFVGRGVTGNSADSLIRSISALRWCKPTSITLLTFNRTLEGKEHIEAVTGLKINRVISYYEQYVADVQSFKYQNWLEFANKADWLSDTKYDAAFIFGGILSDTSKLTRAFPGSYDKTLHGRGYMKFLAVGQLIAAELQLIRVANAQSIRLHEIAFDPQEASVDLIKSFPIKDYRLYHGYDVPAYGMHRVDALTYYTGSVQNAASTLFDTSEKEFDFVFGCTIAAPSRFSLRDKLETMRSSLGHLRTKFYVYDRYMNVKTMVPREVYLSTVQESRFTVLVPAYDAKCFSVYRFQEALAVGCLPLIGCDVVTTDFAKSFSIPDEIIAELRYDYGDLPKISEDRRKELIYILSQLVLNTTNLFHL